MGFMDKVKDFVAPIEEDDDYQEAPQAEKVEEVEPQSRYERPKTRTNATSLNSNTKMVLFEPRSFGEAEKTLSRCRHPGQDPRGISDDPHGCGADRAGHHQSAGKRHRSFRKYPAH